MVNSAHWTKIFLTTHLGTGSIFVFTEKILWIISLILKISFLLPPGSFGGPDADLKLDIMKLNSHIILIKCIISVFSDTLKIYDKKSIIIFGVSESSGFQKYSICWLFQVFYPSLCPCLCHCHCLCICVLLWFLNSFHYKLSEYV